MAIYIYVAELKENEKYDSKENQLPESIGFFLQSTAGTFQRLFPGTKIYFVGSLDFDKHQGGEHNIIVLPGGNAYIYATIMHQRKDNDRCRELVDNGASFVGICAGAYYGSEEYYGRKSESHVFDIHKYLEVRKEYNTEEVHGKPLGIIEGTYAVGPILPYFNARYSSNMTCSHSVTLASSSQSLSTLYMEGPVFLNRDLTAPFASEAVVAHYDFENQAPTLFLQTTESSGNKINEQKLPAVIYEQKKVSHRILMSPHPELACQARTFLPRFASDYEKKVMPLTWLDNWTLQKEATEEANYAFLESVLEPLRKMTLN